VAFVSCIKYIKNSAHKILDQMVKVCGYKPDTENKNKYGVMGLMNIPSFLVHQQLISKTACYAMSAIKSLVKCCSTSLSKSAFYSVPGQFVQCRRSSETAQQSMNATSFLMCL
jgi:hypothetical protein